MAIIVSLGMATTSSQKVSALTNAEKYIQGSDDAVYSMCHNGNVVSLLVTLGGKAFQTHSDAYRIGYISSICNIYGLKLPYTDYRTVIVATGDDGTITPVFTYHYQSTSKSIIRGNER